MFPVPLVRRWPFLLLALVAILAPRPSVAAAPKPWLKLETDEFVIYSDAPEKQIIRCALAYTAYRRAFADLFVSPGRALPRSVLLLFRTEAAFYELVPAKVPNDSDFRFSNFSVEVDGAPLDAFTLENGRSRALELTFEFETVWALKQMGYHVPLWMSQGAGEVLSSVTYAKGSCLVGPSTRRAIGSQFTWPRIFAMSRTSEDYKSASGLAGFLGQAGGIMHWILLSDVHTRERFSALADLLSRTPALDAVAQTMHTPPARFDHAIQAHLRSGAPRKIPFDDDALRASFHPALAPPAEVLTQKSNLLVNLGDLPRGNDQLDLARRLDPDLPVVQEAWARRLLREGQRHEALLAYRAAIAAGTNNSNAYLVSATGRLDDNRSGPFDEAGQGGAQAVLAVTELRQAIKLNPGSAEAWTQLGRAFYVQKEIAPAEIAELSIGLVPGRDGLRVRYYRAMLYARLHRSDDAIADLDLIAAAPDADDHLRQLAGERVAVERVNRDMVVGETFLRAHNYAAVRVLASAGLSGASVTADARQRYSQLLALAADEEAWDNLKALDDGGHADALNATLRDFLERHPDSRHTNDAYELLMRTAFPDRKPAPPPVR